MRRFSSKEQRVDGEATAVERCMNPWNERCSSTDIALYIMFNGKRLPICWKCWKEISSKNIEWKFD